VQESHTSSNKSNVIDKTTNKKTSKGYLLEYRIKRLLFYMGYYTQTNILIKTSSQQPNDIVTDLDVYGFYFLPDFTHSISWVDCKSGNANILQHIGWINGIKSQVNANEVIFIKQNVRKNIKEYARSLGIKIFDLSFLEQLENNYLIRNDDWQGTYDIETQSKMFIEFSKITTPDVNIYKNISNFMVATYWTLDCYSKVKKCITGLKQLASMVLLPLEDKDISAIKWAIYNLTSLFLLATLEICGSLYYFSERDKLSTIAEGLVSGTIPLAKRQELADISHKIASEMIKQYVPDFNEIILSKFNPNTPPSYYESFCDLINRMTLNPLVWSKALRILDFYLMEFDLKNESSPKNFFASLSLQPDDTILSLKTILHFINIVTGVPKELFSLIR
jgi:hypothetical protein